MVSSWVKNTWSIAVNEYDDHDDDDDDDDDDNYVDVYSR